MTCLDRSFYQDPCKALEQKQQREINRKAGMERVCTGCIHRRVLWIGEEKHKVCALKRGWAPAQFCNFKEVEKE